MIGTGRRAWVLLGALLLSVAGMLPVTLTGALAVQIRADFGVGRTWIGVLVSVFFTAGAVSASRIGAAADRVGWRRASVVGGIASAVGLLAMADLARGPIGAALALVVGGVAMSASVATTNLVLAVEMPGQRLGLLLGLKQSAIPLAGLAAGLALPLLALRYGWRWTFAIAAVVPLMAVVAAVTTPPRADRRDRPRLARTDTGHAGLVVGPRLRMLAVGMGLASVIPGALTGFLVLTAVEAGLTDSGAGTLLAACSVVGITMRIGYGWVIDRVRSDAVLHVAGLLAGGAAGAALLATGSPRLVVPGAVVAFACGWGWPGLFFYELLRDHPADPAAATGVAQTGALIGSGWDRWRSGSSPTRTAPARPGSAPLSWPPPPRPRCWPPLAFRGHRRRMPPVRRPPDHSGRRGQVQFPFEHFGPLDPEVAAEPEHGRVEVCDDHAGMVVGGFDHGGVLPTGWPS